MLGIDNNHWSRGAAMFRHRFAIRGAVALVTVALLATAVLLAASGTVLAQSDRVYSDTTGYWRYYNGHWYHYKTYVHGYNPGYYARPDRVLPHGVSPGHYGAYLSPSRPTGLGYPSPGQAPTSAPTQAKNAAPTLPAPPREGPKTTRPGGCFSWPGHPPPACGNTWTARPSGRADTTDCPTCWFGFQRASAAPYQFQRHSSCPSAA